MSWCSYKNLSIGVDPAFHIGSSAGTTWTHDLARAHHPLKMTPFSSVMKQILRESQMKKDRPLSSGQTFNGQLPTCASGHIQVDMSSPKFPVNSFNPSFHGDWQASSRQKTW